VQMICQLLAEPIGQAGEAAHAHAYYQILPLNVAGTNHRRIGLAGF